MKKSFAMMLMLALFISLPLVSAQTEVDQKVMKKIDSLMEKVGKAMEKKDGQKAGKLIDEVLSLKADYAPALHQKARLFYGQDQAQAITLLQQAVAADSSYMPAVKELAALYYQQAGKVQGDLVAQADLYEKALGVNNLEIAEKGLYVECLFNAGALRYQQKNMDKAIPLFEKLSAMKDPVNDKQKNTVRLSNYMLGMAYIQAKKTVEAQASLKKYIELSSALTDDPYLPVARFILAESMMNDLEAQVKEINKDEKEEKTARIAAAAAARVEVVDCFEKAMAQKPELAESVKMYLGNYHYLSGDLAKAIEYYEALTRDYPSSEQIVSYQNFLKELKADKEFRDKEASKKGKKK